MGFNVTSLYKRQLFEKKCIIFTVHFKMILFSYLGRKRLKHENETWVEGSQQLVNVDYSYWTLSYVLSKSGAEKLIKGQPFGQLVPVDEYLPIMFDKHPESRWKEAFSNRNLKVFPFHFI